MESRVHRKGARTVWGRRRNILRGGVPRLPYRDVDGSVHKSPVRPFPHAHQNQNLHRWKLDLFPSLCLGVIDSNPKHGKTLLQLFCTGLGSVPGRKLGFESAVNFERAT